MPPVKFSDKEVEVIRFLKEEFLEKGSSPKHMSAPATLNRDVMAKFNLTLPQYREMMAFFETYGIASAPTIEASNGCVHIEPIVIDVVRQFDSPIEESVPTPNSIHVNTMIGSQIQQGTHDSVQVGEFAIDRISNLRELLPELKEKLQDLELSEEDKQVAESDFQVLEQQVNSPRPKSTVIAECLKSLRTIVEGCAGDLSAAFIIQSISTLLT